MRVRTTLQIAGALVIAEVVAYQATRLSDSRAAPSASRVAAPQRQDEGASHREESSAKPPEPDYVFDLGSIIPREPIKEAFHILNTSSADWKVDRVDSGCKCGNVWDVAKESVAPGEQLEVSVSFKIPEDDGEFRRQATLFLANGAGTIRLGVRGRATRPLVAFPRQIQIETDTTTLARAEGDGRKVVLQVESRVEDPGALSVVQCPRWCRACEIIPLKIDEDEPVATARWQVSLALIPAELGGARQVEGQVALGVVAADGSPQSSLLIPVSAQIRQPVVTYPSQLYFGGLRPHEVRTREAVVVIAGEELTAGAGSPTVAVSPEIENCARVNLTPLGKNRYKLSLVFTAPDVGAISGGVTVKSASEEHAAVVPVFATVVPSVD